MKIGAGALSLRPAAANSAAAAATSGQQGRVIAYWLLCCCGMIFVMVAIGGITRLTRSGLSITEWQPVSGILPPLSAAGWAAEFEKYQQIAQYRLLNYGMSLAEFKTIYLWEYLHRLWGRLIGVAYALPFIYLLLRRQMPRRLVVPLSGIFLLGFAQGALGWYMVKSGLADRVSVSQYRLVAHLVLALAIYAATLWIALGFFERNFPGCPAQHPHPNPPPLAGEGTKQAAPENPPPRAGEGRVGVAGGWRRAAEAILILVALTIVAGGFVAGMNAGHTYNNFPLMDGRVVPAGYAQLQPFILNWFENVAAVQFNHRLLALTLCIAVLLLWLAGWRAALPRSAAYALHALLAAAMLQFALGVATLVLVVPVALGVAHQVGAVVLLSAAIVLRHSLRRP